MVVDDEATTADTPVMCFCNKLSDAVIGNDEDKHFICSTLPKLIGDIRVHYPARSWRGRVSDPGRLLLLIRRRS